MKIVIAPDSFKECISAKEACIAIQKGFEKIFEEGEYIFCLLYTSPSPRDRTRSRMPSSA